MNRQQVVEAAKEAIIRGVENHGEPEQSFIAIADLWTAYLGVEINPEQAAIMMILFKIARQKTRHNDDNFVDIAGYAALAAECTRLHFEFKREIT